MRSDVIDIKSNRFGRLIAVDIIEKPDDRPKGVYWKCVCDCGNIKIVSSSSLRRNLTKSCGCLNLETTGRLNRSHGLSKTRLHKIWEMMRLRCNLPTYTYYNDYGGRGITVCNTWNNSFIEFYNWANQNGYDEQLTIERIDVNGNYEPDNCTWATRLQQGRNKRNTIKINDNGEYLTIRELSEKYNIHESNLYHRLNKMKLALNEALNYGSN